MQFVCLFMLHWLFNEISFRNFHWFGSRNCWFLIFRFQGSPAQVKNISFLPDQIIFIQRCIQRNLQKSLFYCDRWLLISSSYTSQHSDPSHPWTIAARSIFGQAIFLVMLERHLSMAQKVGTISRNSITFSKLEHMSRFETFFYYYYFIWDKTLQALILQSSLFIGLASAVCSCDYISTWWNPKFVHIAKCVYILWHSLPFWIPHGGAFGAIKIRKNLRNTTSDGFVVTRSRNSFCAKMYKLHCGTYAAESEEHKSFWKKERNTNNAL